MTDQTSPVASRGRPKDPAKRQAILDAAKELFLSLGFAGTSMDAVAAEAGVSKLTVYSHFSDKESLFSAAVESKCVNQLPFPMFTLEKDSPVEEILNRIGAAFLAMIDSEDAVRLLRLMCGMASQDGEVARLFFEAGPKRTQMEMERLLRRATELELLQVEDPAAAAEYFFGMLQGCQHMRVLIGCCDAPTEAEIRERVEKVVKVFLRAYSA
ncbi:TetR/AcrR family transcriptional regulator [Microbulbifer rhizosphaerae]|uniref:TetR/AcrR family transcriptional repressor of mexJK operon n=1 Tax=Microbulbifer rhizosphaerae TaxID=1562603 RepID=A0A7W4W8I0_9GAMM|nr:TetR/AcrR family transcriptional regulator [Microbulbifer rhizosphaerae]MBB3059672.1 TetR/AcrR family transcriptional repressor of mexJK operon [Microbulbifer rhizosphaerae]